MSGVPPARNDDDGGLGAGSGEASPRPRGPRAKLARALLLPIAVGSACTLLTVLGFELANRSEPESGAETFAYQRDMNGSGTLPKLWDVPAFSFEDQNRARLTPAALVGKVWVADFIFTTCTSVCPLLSAKMVMLQHQLPAPALHFVSFSVDPVHDTPAALHDYAEQWNAPEARWHLLSTDPNGLATTVAGMRVALEQTGDADNPIMHTSMFFLVDQAGSVRGVYDSSDDAALQRLAADAQGLLGPALAASVAPEANVDGGGARVFSTLGCAACHDNPKLAPSLRGAWGGHVELASGEPATMDAEYVRRSLTAPGQQLAKGYLNIMPAYGDLLTAAQLDGLVGYVQSLGALEMPAGKVAVVPSGVEPAVAPQTAMPRSGAMPRPPSGPLPIAASIVTDPVCEMSVRVSPDTPHVLAGGHEHYFCSASCQEKFAANPAKYLR